MKYVDEYRDESAVRRVLDDIRLTVTRPWTIMEFAAGRRTIWCALALTNCCPKKSNWCMARLPRVRHAA